MQWRPTVNATTETNAPIRFQPQAMSRPGGTCIEPPFAVLLELSRLEDFRPEADDFDTVRWAFEEVSVTVDPEITVSDTSMDWEFSDHCDCDPVNPHWL